MRTTVTVFDQLGAPRQVTSNTDIESAKKGLPKGWKVVEGRHVDGVYFKNGKVRPLEKMEITISKTTVNADGVDQVVIDNTPVNTRVIIKGPVSDQYTDPDTTVELSFDYPGDYQVKLECFPYNPELINISAL